MRKLNDNEFEVAFHMLRECTGTTYMYDKLFSGCYEAVVHQKNLDVNDVDKELVIQHVKNAYTTY